VSDGFFEFADDDSSAGFRLERVELYNWGTFNNRVWVLPLGGNNGLLTGDIGSGKSTVVDAVTTLLVPAHKVSYNKAAGAEFKERSLRSYVLGYFKSERSDGGFSARPVPLRKEGTTHSVILGVFRNRGYNQTVTLAQVFRQKESSGQPDRFYVVCDGYLSITGDFSDFGRELGQLKRRLRKRDKTEVFDTFPLYGAAFRRRFGLKNEQALELFHQTVSLKAVGNLTSFVREHMLEAFDAEEFINHLIQHFEDLNKSHEAVMMAKKQIRELSPLVEHLDDYEKTFQEVESMVLSRDSLKFYFSLLKKALLEERINRDSLSKEKLELKMEEYHGRLSVMKDDRDRIIRDIASSGGDRLETLIREFGQLEEEKTARLRRAGEYDVLARKLEFPLLTDSDIFADNCSRIKEQIEIVTENRMETSNTLSEIQYEFKGIRKEHQTLEHEIISLKSRKSNIDSQQITLRGRLCNDLNLQESELPFAGELIAVKEEESAWEGALERVLRNFGLSLLVPEEHYARVVRWVDETRLHGRLVYYRVSEFRKSHTPPPEKSALTAKIMLKRDSDFYDWLKDQLSRRFDYICCESLEEFRRTGKGLTRSGQVKGSPIRHEKDDRHNLADRSRYILGWTNQAKISTLEKQKKNLEQSLAELASRISGLQTCLSGLERQMTTLTKIEGFSHYEDLDWKPSVRRIDQLKAEIERLREASDTLKFLQEEKDRIDGEIKNSEEKYRLTGDSLTRILDKLDRSQKAVEIEDELLATIPLPRSEIESLIDPLLESSGYSRFQEEFSDSIKPLHYESCNKVEQEIREKLQIRIDSGKKRLDRLAQNIVVVMQNFRRDYPSETRDMDASLEAGHEYRSFLDRLNRENLPRFEDQFKTLLNENTIREIAGFQARLNQECQTIKERVERINKSMSAIEYNRDRYITLEVLATNDVEIRSFQQELKACIEGSLGGDGDQYTEAKFLQVREIINRFKGREGRSDLDKKWTLKVTDVRNWFVFAASERWREDDTEYEHYTDSGGKSGGQKEKLAYTVLAASLAYQFGLEWGEVRSRSFRFVVIDEAFGRGSDESARYGLELFRKLNLQLLIITPLQKIHIIEPYVSTVGFVHNEEGCNSLLRCLTIDEYRDEKERRRL